MRTGGTYPLDPKLCANSCITPESPLMRKLPVEQHPPQVLSKMKLPVGPLPVRPPRRRRLIPGPGAFPVREVDGRSAICRVSGVRVGKNGSSCQPGEIYGKGHHSNASRPVSAADIQPSGTGCGSCVRFRHWAARSSNREDCWGYDPGTDQTVLGECVCNPQSRRQFARAGRERHCNPSRGNRLRRNE